MLRFETDGRLHPVRCMLADRIVEHFDVVERVGPPRLIPRAADFVPVPLALEQVEEAPATPEVPF
jgi:hypothetical protein